MNALTVERSRKIVAYAENGCQNGFPDDLGALFKKAGAASRKEAIQALMIVIADYYQRSHTNSSDLKKCESYVSASEAVPRQLMMENRIRTQVLPREKDIPEESPLQFLAFLKSLAPNEPDYWPEVYRHLGT